MYVYTWSFVEFLTMHVISSANDATTSLAEAVIVSGCCVDAAARTVFMKYETKSS